MTALAGQRPALDLPAWVGQLTDAQLRRQAGATTFARAGQYARSQAVLSLTVAADRLFAEVRGSGRQRYSCLLSPGPSGFVGRCTCPVGVSCKHAVAVLLHARATSAPPVAAWEGQLSGLLAGAAQEQEALALCCEVVPGGRYRDRVRLRPLRRGASGRWVKTGASWRDLEGYSGQRRAAARSALVALRAAWRATQPAWSYGESHVWLDELGRSGWTALVEARRAGVTLLDERDRPVRLLEGAEVVADLRVTAPDGAVTLACRIAADGLRSGQHVTLVGRPADGLFAGTPDGLALAPLVTPLDEPVQALFDAGPIVVPAADLPRLYRRYLPGLRRRARVVSSDGSLALPEALPPRLRLAVRREPGHVVELAWSFGYPLLEEVLTVPLTGPSGEVERDPAAETALLASLAGLPDVPGLWAERPEGRRPQPDARLTGLATARFVAELLPALQAHPSLDVEVSDDPWPRYEPAVNAPAVTVSASDTGASTDWFDLAVSVSVDGQDVPLPRLLAALTAGEEHLLLESGTWFALDRPELQALRRLVAEAGRLRDREGRLRVSPYQAGLWQELVEAGVVAQASERWQRTVGRLLDLDSLPVAALPAGLDAELRPYQRDGFTWLSLLWDLRLGGILADDMGLGKTLQTLALVARAHEQGELTEPLLVVAPTSVVGTWAEQAQRFCPQLPVVAVTETQRRSGVPLAERLPGAALVVTSYALLRLDEDAYLEQPWSGLVLDEAQHVKNSAAKTYAVVRRLQAPFALAITGTPMENSLMDLWSLLSITAPGLFPDPQAFTESYRRPIETERDAEALAALRRRVRPLMLRRTKEQVAADLPPKIEQVVEVTLSPAHRRLYDRHLARERQRVLGLLEDLQRNRFAILKSLTVLRQLSLDPALIDPAHASVVSSKVDVLIEQLVEVAREGHRALVFSSFTGFLRRVRERLDAEGLGHVYLDGRTRDRPRRIAAWREGDDPVFLISLKAGGTGLTLTEADYVFVLDPWWNPATEAQAVDRAHRIGQTRSVNVYRLVAADTIEQKVIALQERKRELFAAVVDGDGAASTALTADDIRALLS